VTDPQRARKGRRRWRIARRAIAATILLLAVYSFVIEPNRLVVQHTTLVIDRWPADAPMRIALIADLHAGAPWIDEGKIARVVAETNAEHPDLTLLLGDIFNEGVLGGHAIPAQRTAAILGGLKARYGVFAVLGNHDGWRKRAAISRAAYEGAGIQLLTNETRQLSVGNRHIIVAGLGDLWTDHPDVGIVHGMPEPIVLMMHNPDLFPLVPDNVVLTVAGHTHGGQAWFPLFGRLIVPSHFKARYAFGHVVEEGRDLFVTSGIGTTIIPARFCVPPEIRLLEVRGGAHPAARPSPATANQSTP